MTMGCIRRWEGWFQGERIEMVSDGIPSGTGLNYLKM
jgi:hypothetical protein